MIWTVLRCSLLSLARDRVVLGLMFVLPVVFFSVFAGVFTNMGGGPEGMPAVAVAVVDEDRSPQSARLIAALDAEAALDVRRRTAEGEPDYDRAAAQKLVEDGRIRAAVVIPPGFGADFGGGGVSDQVPVLELMADPVADPIAAQMVSGLIQKTVMTGMPDLMIERGLGQFERYAGAMTDQQREAMDHYLPLLRRSTEAGGAADGGADAPSGGGMAGLVGVEIIDVRRPDAEAEGERRHNDLVAFYAASIGVMFLLFSMSGAAGALLQEEASGTLERVLNAGVGMGRLLSGYWVFAAAMGCVQLAVMFIWGWAVFGLDLWTPGHVAGAAVMTVCSAAAASAFGLMLGTACRSQAQLGGISTIVILLMSVVGGSTFPRFLMSESMQKVGLATFNGWAIDGYQKVFWRERPVWELLPQVAVLGGMAVVFLLIARLLARRWESV